MRDSNRTYAIVLASLAFAFGLRVAGQAIVAGWQVNFLPPMEQWYSGLIPYPVLLPTQIVILILQAWISWDLWRKQGVFARRRAKIGPLLNWFAFAYFLVMVVRYILTMSLYPEQRWFSIPIFFHWVLAAYIFALGQYHRGVGTSKGHRIEAT